MITLVPVDSNDPFVFKVFATNKREETALWGWTDEQCEAFAQMQFQMRKGSYALQFPHLCTRRVDLDHQPAGCLMTALSDDVLYLVDVTLLPAYRRRGIGTELLKRLQDEALQMGVPIRLTVRKENPVRNLYVRFGFLVVSENDLDKTMQWYTPGEEVSASR